MTLLLLVLGQVEVNNADPAKLICLKNSVSFSVIVSY